MLHFTCDLCGKVLVPGQDGRFVLKMEVFPAHDPGEITEDDLDSDHLEEVGHLIAELQDGEELGESLPPTHQKFRYDLCPECHGKFLRDPLNRDSAQKLHFSEN